MVADSSKKLGPVPIILTMLVVGGFIALIVATWPHISDANNDPKWPDADGWGLVVLSMAYMITGEIWMLNGFRVVKAEEVAMVSLFGRPLLQRGSGLLYAPSPWAVRVESSLPIEEPFPPVGTTPAVGDRQILITHGISPTPTGDPLDSRLTTSVRLVVRYRIRDLLAFSQAVGTVDHARGRLRDKVVTATQAECGRRTVGSTLRTLPEVNRDITEAVRAATSDWGIELLEVVLQDIDLGGSITDAMRNASVSIINLETNRNNAQQKLFEGQAAADVHRAFQYAKAEGYKMIARELGVSEPIVLYQLETLANMWRRNNADVNLYGGDLGEVFKMVTSFAKIVDGSRDEAPVAPPQLRS